MDNLFENKSFLLQLEDAFNDAYGRNERAYIGSSAYIL